MSTFKHAGVDITLDPVTGKFTALLAGKSVTTPSLDAMKKKIDGDEKSKFKQFTAIKDAGKYPGRERYVKVLIVGLKRSRATSYRGEDYWITSTSEALATVYADTPESLQLLKDKDALREQHEKEKDAMDRLHREQRAHADSLLAVLKPPAK